MADNVSSPSIWTSTNHDARLTLGPITGQLNIDRPDLGISIEGDLTQTGSRLFCTIRTGHLPAPKTTSLNTSPADWPLALAESYVRGNDLIASYKPSEEWPYAPQLYWQAHSLECVEGVRASLSYMVSLHTHLLDTRPSMSVASVIPCREALLLTIPESGEAMVEPIHQPRTIESPSVTLCALRRISSELSYIEIALGSDIHSVHCHGSQSGRGIVEWRLFSEFLEKGVIRRSRVHGALLPASEDCELALECCRAASEFPPALTA